MNWVLPLDAAALLVIALVNVWYHRRRAGMTVDERAADDAETLRESRLW